MLFVIEKIWLLMLYVGEFLVVVVYFVDYFEFDDEMVESDMVLFIELIMVVWSI